MAILTTTTYKCDICKKNIDTPVGMFTYILPVKEIKIVNNDFHRRSEYDREWATPSKRSVDLCKNCNDKLISALEKSYGTIKVFIEPCEEIMFESSEE